jgi:hypothetical protein
MFGFIRRLNRPFGMIGEKLSEIFRIGKKTNTLSDIRNTERFADLAPSGLRFRQPPQEIRGMDGGFYGDMNSMLKSYKYPNS